MGNIKTRMMVEEDIRRIAKAFADQGWNKPESQYETYFKQQEDGIRQVIVAEIDGAFAGYITIVFESEHTYLSERNIPEIVDFNVLIKYRNQGAGTLLMDVAEDYCYKNHEVIGLYVGLLGDYGSAQRLYVKRGYIPTGTGIQYGNKVLNYFDEVKVDDDLVLGFTKKRKV